MWTIVDYLYRDAGNNKAFGQIALTGAISAEDEQIIREKMPEGELFIAEQIVVPPLYAELERWSGGPTDEDHCWHELGGFRTTRDETQIDGLVRWGTSGDFLLRFKMIDRWTEALSPNYRLALST